MLNETFSVIFKHRDIAASTQRFSPLALLFAFFDSPVPQTRSNAVVMTSSIRKDTFEYLSEHYPSILPCVPNDVLEFGLPDRGITIVTVILLTVLLVISVIGNSLMVFLYARYFLVHNSVQDRE